jgi:REP element-mobilizing transposase RayT
MSKQLELKGCAGHGGKRRGAGRPNLSGTVAHMKREQVNFKIPTHITYRLRPVFPNIRRPVVVSTLKRCCERAKRFGFHVVHYSIQSNHLHLICEARDNEALARGLQSFASSFAKAIKRLMEGWKDVGRRIKGSLFHGRYHLRTIKTPTQMKNTLRYVLLNESHHTGIIEYMDRFSSAKVFVHWRRLLGRQVSPVIAREMRNRPQDPAIAGLSPPRSWLAREGWMRV